MSTTATTSDLLKDRITDLRYTLDRIDEQLQRDDLPSMLCARAAVSIDHANSEISQLVELLCRNADIPME